MEAMSKLLEQRRHHQAIADALQNAAALRHAAERLIEALPECEVLLARTDAAHAVCCAAAVLDRTPRRVQRAYIGRSGWTAPVDSVLVELTSAMASTLSNALPSQAVLYLELDLRTPGAATEAAAVPALRAA